MNGNALYGTPSGEVEFSRRLFQSVAAACADVEAAERAYRADLERRRAGR